MGIPCIRPSAASLFLIKVNGNLIGKQRYSNEIPDKMEWKQCLYCETYDTRTVRTDIFSSSLALHLNLSLSLTRARVLSAVFRKKRCKLLYYLRLVRFEAEMAYVFFCKNVCVLAPFRTTLSIAHQAHKFCWIWEEQTKKKTASIAWNIFLNIKRTLSYGECVMWELRRTGEVGSSDSNDLQKKTTCEHMKHEERKQFEQPHRGSKQRL